ncbi:MAG TPA: hypothetical protein VLA36_14925, partial [Longimicrobiales bacterium]|nr:hypothetical protein [Longimicrobiales bacterium]
MNRHLESPRRSGLGLRIAVLLALGTGIAGAALTVSARQERGFPHETHQRLFPLCTGCHEGIPTENVATMFPSPEACARCHNGADQQRVGWTGPSVRVDNLRFQHDIHAAILEGMEDPEQPCQACHVPPGGQRMAVSDQIQMGTCLGCHAHEATEHQVDADCSTCHLPLAQSGFGRSQIEAFVPPSDHEAETFMAGGHGQSAGANIARCATCHTQDRCVSCHVDTERPEIAAMPAAPAGMDLPEAVAHYNIPATHSGDGWLSEHGSQASRPACATCHTTESCMACHVSPVPGAVAALPSRDDVVAPGVSVLAHKPDSHESFFFIDVHSTLAASDQKSCTTCHVQSFCIACHEAPARGGYHPASFVSRHGAESFGRDTECASCHDPQVFCRSCHVQMGIVSQGRLGPGYHEGGATWLLRHPQAARQNLESCTSCHTQRDCTQCHGVLGAFKVNPHSSD